MKSELQTCRFLILFIVVFINLTTGELEFYQDVEPERAADVNFKTLKRILEFENQQHGIHHTREIPHTYPITYEDYLPKYTSEKQKTIFEILSENPRIFEMLQKNKFSNINNQQQSEYNVLNENPRSMIEREHSYVNLETPSKSYEYPNVNVPYPERNVNEKIYYNHGNYIPARMIYTKWKNFESNIADKPMIKLQDKVINSQLSDFSNSVEVYPVSNLLQKWDKPDFTYKFDDISMNVANTFGIKPNDPRYYEKDISSNSKVNKQSMPSINYIHTIEIPHDEKAMNKEHANIISHVDERQVINSKFSNMPVMPEPQRRTDHEAVFTTSTFYNPNNDAYFIAIVAGCSAAAMFALVLISLTWCRLQRGAKAAADIDYPAYGVTGPNKDISPSGDQRLAHSAQMYHFQHQKQQIIAMEKTPAAREPGSVSEAESDEENEEGDYTVYECPGLAPAGEMEVKNPLFHDDPTPTTPSQNHKDIDRSKQ